MSVLQIFRGDDFLDEVVLSRAVYGLGRHPQNDIVLDDRSLSRFHARVERRGERFVVVDCGAQNGVHLNGQRIVGESDLAPDDRITLGRYVAVFRSKSVPARGPTPSENQTKAPTKAPTKGEAKLDARHGKKNGKARPEPRREPEPEPEPDLDIEVSLEGDEVPDEREDRTKKARPHKGDPTLVLLYNGMEVSRHPIGSAKLTVGRSKQCDVVIGLLGLSRKHAQVERRGKDIFVEDLGSQNGTWVNNQRIPNNRKLKHGDLLNFYDYAVLYLEDGNVEVGFHGASFTPPSDEHPSDDLSHRETGRGDPGAGKAAVRLPSMRGPAPIADSVASGKAAQASQSELVDLGEGSFLGDEFEAASQDQAPSSLVDEEAEDDDAKRPGNTTDLIAQLEIGDSAANLDAEADRAFREAEEFAEELGTEGELGRQSDRTSTSAGSGGHAWPRDADLMMTLSNAPDGSLVTVEVTLAGKPYTQLPLSQTVTRVGTDARCELSLPKSAGLTPWHLTLLHLGGAVVLYRAARTAAISLAGTDIDMAVLKNGDLVDLGRVRLKIRMA